MTECVFQAGWGTLQKIDQSWNISENDKISNANMSSHYHHSHPRLHEEKVNQGISQVEFFTLVRESESEQQLTIVGAITNAIGES